jgi:hypothetical protein
MVWVRERTIPTQRLPLVGEVIANLCGSYDINKEKSVKAEPQSRKVGFHAYIWNRNSFLMTCNCEYIKISSSSSSSNRLVGLVVRVPGYGVHSASWVQLRSYLEEKVAAPF